MSQLVVGIVLWWFAHLFKRLFPAARARLGAGGKGLVALVLLLSVVLMVRGYRAAPFEPVYDPPPGMGHLNNLLMLISLYLFGAGSVKGRMAAMIRHPMLWGMVLWAVAHLLVNGDLASLILFGGLGLWALVEMAVINIAEGPWRRPAPGPWKNDLKAVFVALILYAIIAAIHIWLGRNPFLGSYP